MSEAKRHHYIPQFILRNFLDDNGQVSYWDIEKEVLEKRNTRSVFMNFDMYRDELNYRENPTAIESSLSVFESEIANLINNKFLKNDEITITRSELESLRIFLELLSFRSDLRKDQYINSKFTESTRDVLSEYANGDYVDLWKKEVDALSKCRTYEDINKSKEIDPIIKMDFMNAIKGYYMTVVEARGGDFLLTDVYPTLEVYPMTIDVNIHLHCIYPFSNKRALLLNHVMFKPCFEGDILFEPMRKVSKIKGDMIALPRNRYKIGGRILSPEDEFIYRVRKIYSSDVESINALLLNEARIGVMFKNAEDIQESVIQFNRRNDTKKKYDALENRLR